MSNIFIGLFSLWIVLSLFVPSRLSFFLVLREGCAS